MRAIHRTGPVLLALGIAVAGCSPAGTTSSGKPDGTTAAAAKPYPASELVVLEVPGMH